MFSDLFSADKKSALYKQAEATFKTIEAAHFKANAVGTNPHHAERLGRLRDHAAKRMGRREQAMMQADLRMWARQ